MKKLLGILVLGLFLITPSQADDISDFQIEGMSIGDSLLDYFSENEINGWYKTFYPASKKFYLIEAGRSKSSYELYDDVGFHIRNNDKKYIIVSLKGAKFFKNNLKACMKEKEKITLEISNILPNVKEEIYDYKYKSVSDGNSIAYISDFKADNGDIRIWCADWSVVTEKEKNWDDNLAVSISSSEFLNWLYTESE